MPLTKLASATCQTSSVSVQARSIKTSELSNIKTTTAIKAVRRSTRSAIAPTIAPNSVIGSMRSIVSNATMNGDPVR
jgi:hypothetical protein